MRSRMSEGGRKRNDLTVASDNGLVFVVQVAFRRQREGVKESVGEDSDGEPVSIAKKTG